MVREDKGAEKEKAKRNQEGKMRKKIIGARIECCPRCGKLFGVGAMNDYRIPKHKCKPTKDFEKRMEKTLKLLKTILKTRKMKTRKKRKKDGCK